MLKLIAFNYTVMPNSYSQWLNIKGRKIIYRDVEIIKKMPLKKYKKNYLLFVHLKIECQIIAI